MMLTRGECRRAVEALRQRDAEYWTEAPGWEWVTQTLPRLLGVDIPWDGDHWAQAHRLAREGKWKELKKYADEAGETHWRELLERTLKEAAPRLYGRIWQQSC